MSKFQLTEDERSELLAARKATKNQREHTRMTVILALDDGMEAKTIARAHRLDENTVRVWCERYKDKGVYGLGDDHYVPPSPAE